MSGKRFCTPGPGWDRVVSGTFDTGPATRERHGPTVSTATQLPRKECVVHARASAFERKNRRDLASTLRAIAFSFWKQLCLRRSRWRAAPCSARCDPGRSKSSLTGCSYIPMSTGPAGCLSCTTGWTTPCCRTHKSFYGACAATIFIALISGLLSYFSTRTMGDVGNSLSLRSGAICSRTCSGSP